MRTSVIAIMIAIGTMTIASGASATGSTQVAGLSSNPTVLGAGMLPKPAPSPFISAGVQTASLQMLPPVMWYTAPRATIQIVADPRTRFGYPYLTDMTIDGATVAQRIIRTPMAAVLQSVIVVDGTPHQACARMLRMGEPGIVVAQRCFDVQIGTSPQSE